MLSGGSSGSTVSQTARTSMFKIIKTWCLQMQADQQIRLPSMPSCACRHCTVACDRGSRLPGILSHCKDADSCADGDASTVVYATVGRKRRGCVHVDRRWFDKLAQEA